MDDLTLSELVPWDMTNFNLSISERAQLLEQVSTKLERYYAHPKYTDRVAHDASPAEVREYIAMIDFSQPLSAADTATHVLDGLQKYAVHTPHPMYYGLYNPRTNYPSAIADYVAAVLNPQLAAWSHAPFANEVEQHIIRELGVRFGYDRESVCGTFASGGAEANMTAILCALFDRIPDYAKSGLLGCDRRPIIYCSAESHHSVHKAAKLLGLGLDSVSVIAVNDRCQMDIEVLNDQIATDSEAGLFPLMVVTTAGTTGLAAIDDMNNVRVICDRHSLWMHVDAAYGGGAILSKRYKHLLSGIDTSDSITFDAHKWMSVPMGGSLFLSSHRDVLSKTFGIKTDYMPDQVGEDATVDPYTSSIQWSRRFIGLKVYMSLLTFGWQGYEDVITHQIEIGRYLDEQLAAHSWAVLNDTDLPVSCFSMSGYIGDDRFATHIVDHVVASGASWISTYPVHGQNAVRACITNYDTTKENIDQLIHLLDVARSDWRSQA